MHTKLVTEGNATQLFVLTNQARPGVFGIRGLFYSEIRYFVVIIRV